MAWTRGLKSITIYRDKSKLSQPLSSFGNDDDILSRSICDAKLDLHEERVNEVIESVVKEVDRREKESGRENEINEVFPRHKRISLPSKRRGYIQKSKIGGHSLFLHTGEYEDGKLGEIFIDMHREGAAFRSLLNSFAIAISLGLQYGVPLEEFVDAFVFSKFEPNGMVQGHDRIKMVTSVIDYIFRDLAINYLGRTDLAQVNREDLDSTEIKLSPPSHMEEMSEEDIDQIIRDAKAYTKKMKEKERSPSNESDARYIARMKGYEGDPCPNCGSFTLIRNGTCMKCDTCGNTTGCS
jgi:ribonucleoside-diphosphate reductase alpha chain